MTKWKNRQKARSGDVLLITCITPDCGEKWLAPLPAPFPRLCPPCRDRHRRIVAARLRMGEPEGREFRVVI